jgi:transcriptional regulator with XRE-family HTH domain
MNLTRPVRYCRCGTRLARDNRGIRCGVCLVRDRDLAVGPSVVPEGFWADEDMVRALGTWHMGRVIAAYRNHPGHGRPLRQEVVAGWVGISQAQLSRIENGLAIKDLDKLAHWARTLGVPARLLWFKLPGQRPMFSKPDQVGPPLEDPKPPPGGAGDDVGRDQAMWLRTRRAPGSRGRELSELAAWLYPVTSRAPGGHVLAGPGWLLDQPVELGAIRLEWSGQASPAQAMGPIDHVLPLTERGARCAGYSRAVRDLVRPRLLQDRLSYRLLGVRVDDGLTLTFGATTFFEVFDRKEALAHEFKAAWSASRGSLPGWESLPLRTAIDDPFNPTRVLMSPGIVTLTIRRDRGGQTRFVLHERDGGSVADGGGMCTAMPAGEFQPSSVAEVDVRNDFSLWRNIMREFSEEFLGNPEHDGGGVRSIDYDREEPFRSFQQARDAGQFQVWHYGLVMDALTLGASQQTVAVVEGETFDRLFAGLVTANDEGRVVRAPGGIGVPFTADAIDRLEPRLSASSLTLLRLAWRDRRLLLD